MMKQKLYLVALLCATLLGVTSCDIVDDDIKNVQTLNGTFTITGSYPDYKLIQDNGTIVYPSASNVSDITDKEGFGNHKRAQFYVNYHPEDVTTENGTNVIRNAELHDGVYLIEQKILTEAEATEAGLLKEDSIYTVKSIDSWFAYGYLTSIITASYTKEEGNIIYPSVNLYAKCTGDNAVTFTLLYNRHKTNGVDFEGTFPYSFDITSFNVPGNDSITVTLEVKDRRPSSIKVARKDFYSHAQ
jgi:hypothetical protein